MICGHEPSLWLKKDDEKGFHHGGVAMAFSKLASVIRSMSWAEPGKIHCSNDVSLFSFATLMVAFFLALSQLPVENICTIDKVAHADTP